MKRYGWLTDIHLNFLHEDALRVFLEALRAERLDALLIGGDIAEADTLTHYLGILDRELDLPIYFVLGNHDYYFGSLQRVRHEVRNLCAASRNLRWLSEGILAPLSPDTALIGHDGWADGRYGDYERSTVQLGDYFVIADFANLDPAGRLRKLNDLGDEAARYFEDLLPRALDSFEHVLLLTHVPPFRQACWYDGRISGDDYLPHFSCQAVGEVFARTMLEYPERRLTVLCGHTHAGGVAEIAANLLVKTGAAEYGAPGLQEVLSI